jgi:hypothetical protein
MAQYMFSAYSVAGAARPQMTEEEMQQGWQKVLVLEEEMRSAGALIFSGKLNDPDTATVVRVANGDVMTTDGPFAESKEHLGGFYIIEANDLDAALVWASKTTAAVGAPIEVRPFWEMPDAGRARCRRLTRDRRGRDRPHLPRGVRPMRGNPDPGLR